MLTWAQEATRSMPSLDFIVGPRPRACTAVREAALELLGNGLNPAHLVLVALREDAAERLARALADQAANLPRVVTPTSLAREILRRQGRAQLRRALGDLEEQLVLAHVIANSAELTGPFAHPAVRSSQGFAQDVGWLITQLKQLRIDPPAFDRLIQGLPDERALKPLAAIYRAYAEHLARAEAADYRGAVWLALEALESDGDLLAQLRGQWRHMLIDGAEDLSPLEWELLRAVGADADVRAWADPAQSIFGFRGAVREPWELLRGAGARPLFHQAAPVEPPAVSFAAFARFEDEAAWVAGKLRELAHAGAPAAVIVRSRTEAGRFEAALVRHGAPLEATASGAGAWLMTRFIRDSLELLARGPRLLSERRMPRAEAQRVNDALMHLLGYCRSGGDALTVLGTVAASARRAGRLLLHPPAGRRSAGAAEDTAVRWARDWYLAHFPAECEDIPRTILRLAAELRPGWQCDSHATHEAMRTLGTFLRRAGRLQETFQRVFGTSVPVQEILDQLADLVGRDGASTQATIAVLTCHEAKGREFHTVFLPGLAEGVFPQTSRPPRLISQRAARALCDRVPGLSGLLERPEEALAEERRAFHVARSCAVERLLLSCHLERGGQIVTPSRFLIEALPSGVGRAECALCHRRAPAAEPADCGACPVDPCPGRESRHTDGPWIVPVETRPAATVGPPVMAGHENLPLSASALKTYAKCPRRFFFERLLRVRDEGGDAATYGTIAHEALRRISQWAPEEREPARAGAEVRAVIEEHAEDFSSPAHRRQCEHELTDAVNQYLNHTESYARWRTIAAEAGVEVELTDDTGQPHAFVGRLDLIAEAATGVRALVDFKTATGLAKTPDTIRKWFYVRDGEKPGAERDYQLALYALAPQAREGVEQLAIQPIWPEYEGPPSPRVIEIGPAPGKGVLSLEELDDISRQLANLAREIKGREWFEPNPKACRNCPCLEVCDGGAEAE